MLMTWSNVHGARNGIVWFATVESKSLFIRGKITVFRPLVSVTSIFGNGIEMHKKRQTIDIASPAECTIAIYFMRNENDLFINRQFLFPYIQNTIFYIWSSTKQILPVCPLAVMTVKQKVKKSLELAQVA